MRILIQPGPRITVTGQATLAYGGKSYSGFLKLYRDGKLVFTGDEVAFSPVDETDPKRLVGAGVVQLKHGTAAGGYVIQILVTDLLEKGKEKVASQWIDFDVVN